MKQDRHNGMLFSVNFKDRKNQVLQAIISFYHNCCIVRISPKCWNNPTLHPQRISKLNTKATNPSNKLELQAATGPQQPNNKSVAVTDEMKPLILYVGIGTPPRMVWLMIDTGGGLIWTQCQPCIDCSTKTMPFSIRELPLLIKGLRLPCNHYLCSGPNSRFKCVDGEYCVYEARYGRGKTKGVVRPLYLRFTDDVPRPRGVIHRTPFATGPAIKYYMLNLLDISINSHCLNFPPNTFRKIPSGATNGFVIDAGAPNTMIDQRTNGGNAYRVVIPP
ncbi:hypothetical protein LWI29_030015 [Acer saccharum]|uniref:Peptidase A1 domain-containing protein n=1 Tax=Acer saccharum TaxID=4024 RepID=A0AA39W3B0_ACESA|nr:hypothetical protein LWI29_030015 [Acer saccharum]